MMNKEESVALSVAVVVLKAAAMRETAETITKLHLRLDGVADQKEFDRGSAPAPATERQHLVLNVGSRTCWCGEVHLLAPSPTVKPALREKFMQIRRCPKCGHGKVTSEIDVSGSGDNYQLTCCRDGCGHTWSVFVHASLLAAHSSGEGQAAATHDEIECGCGEHADFCPFNPTASVFVASGEYEWVVDARWMKVSDRSVTSFPCTGGCGAQVYAERFAGVRQIGTLIRDVLTGRLHSCREPVASPPAEPERATI